MTLFGVFIPIYALNTGQPEFTCSKLTMEWCQWRRFDVFIASFEQISHIILIFPLLTSNE